MKSNLSILIITTALFTVGISWLPIIAIGGIIIEVDNLGRLFAIALLPLLFLTNGFRLRFESIIFVLFLWILWTATLMSVHSGLDGMAIIRMWFIETLFAYTIVNCKLTSYSLLKLAAIVSVISTTLVFVISAYTSGVDIIGDSARYIINQDRSHFVYKTLKNTFNAFIPYTTNVDEYNSSVMNKLAASYSLFYTLLIFIPSSKSRIIKVANYAAISICILLIFLLFSTSSVIMFIFSTTLFLWQLVKRSNNFMLLALLLSIGVLLFSISIVYIGSDVLQYLSSQFSSDTGSRDGRIQQFSGALAYIGQNPILGIGYVKYGKDTVHNWLLFSWMAGGIISFLLALIIYTLISLRALTIRVKTTNSLNDSKYIKYLLMSLSFIFLVRTMIGGSGGVATGAGMMSLALFLLTSRTEKMKKIYCKVST